MKLDFHNPDTAATNWQNLCVKAGVPEAGHVHGRGAPTAELHESRKAMRRAINKITENMGIKDYNNDTTDALMHAGVIVKMLNEKIDYAAGATNVDTKVQSIRAMRNSADFEKHYSAGEHSHAMGDSGDMSITDFLRGVANLKTSPSVQNALSTGTDSAGGFSVPSRLMPGILGAMVPVSSLMQAGASIIPLEEGAKSFTTAALNTIPTAAWRAESGALATSDPTFRAVVATPRSLSFQFKISRELLADGQGIQQALYIAIAQAFAKELDRAGLRGTGTAPEPRGISNTSGIQAVGNGTNGAALAGYANLFSATQSLLSADAPMPTAAIMSPRSLVKLGGLVDTTGQPLRVPGMLENVKLIGTSQIPNNLTVGTSTDCSEIYVGDFTNLYFAMRESVSVQMLQELYAGTGEIGFACHVRADVVLTYPGAFAAVTGVRA
jgi:HK97 family phage major capsid protein